MAHYRVFTPVEGFSGESAGVMFSKGEALVEPGPALAYFKSAGYRIESTVPEGEQGAVSVPSAGDSKADWAIHAKTLLDDDETTDIDGMTKAQLMAWVKERKTS